MRALSDWPRITQPECGRVTDCKSLAVSTVHVSHRKVRKIVPPEALTARWKALPV